MLGSVLRFQADCFGIGNSGTSASACRVYIAYFDQGFFPVEILSPVGKMKKFNQTYANIGEVIFENIFWRSSLSNFFSIIQINNFYFCFSFTEIVFPEFVNTHQTVNLK